MSESAATTQEDRSPQDSTDSLQTVASPTNDDMDVDETLLRPGIYRALFSTNLGRRAKNNVSIPAPPVIVRSDKIRSVVDTANFWRQKYPRFAWSIFPDCGWTVEDLWDAADIHLETRDHCQEVLKFLSKDNAVSAGLYAKDWSIMYPEQFARYMGLASMTGICDSEDPHSIADKIFVNGEINNWPRKFLWHTAQAMRTSVVQVRAEEKLATVADSETTSRVARKELAVIASSAQSGLPTNKAPKPLTVRNMPAPFVPANPSVHEVQRPVDKRVPSHVSTQSNPRYHGQPIGHIMSGMSTHASGSPSMGAPALLNPKSRPVRQDAYNPSSSGTYGENLTGLPSSGYSSRPPSGAMHSVHSPHFDPTTMAVSHAVPPHHMHPFAQGYPPMSPATYPAQTYPAGLGHFAMLPPQQTYPANMSMPLSYGQQASNHRGLRGTTMGDMTNSPYYPNNILPHNIDSRKPDRHNSFYRGSNGSLFDPYSGAKPTFNESMSARKSSRGGFLEQPGRSRKCSGADNRPRNGSYGSDWADTTTAHGNRHHDSRVPRVSMSDDPNIVEDPIRGCHQSWIGPENHNVNELFVADVPDGAQAKEVEDMFVREMGITPMKAHLKPSYHSRYLHAFVLFASTADAKLALRANEASPKIRGMPVRVSVPRRFYQKEDQDNNVEPQHSDNQAAKELDTRGVTRMSSHEEENVVLSAEAQANKLQYSPQDARSDLQKKASHPSPEADPASRGSPEAQKISMCQPSPVDAQANQREQSAEEEPAVQCVQETQGATNAADTEQHTVASKFHDGGGIDASLESIPKEKSLEDDEAVAIEESSSRTPTQFAQEPVATTGHVRVESQTKATYESADAFPGTGEAAAVVVKVPTPTKDNLLPLQQTPTMDEVEKVPKVDLPSTVSPESGSEDEADHNSSFLSAQEVVDNGELTTVHKVEPSSTNLGTEPTKAAASESSLQEHAPSSPTIDRDIPQNTPPSSTDLETAAQIPTTLDSSTPALETSVPAKDMSTTIMTPSPPSATAVKKQGPQHTPSLNPFAKPSKSQRKKEKKELKKKGLKKDQEEKTTNAKTDIIVSISGPKSSTSAVNSTSEVPLAAQAQPSAAATDSTNYLTGKDKAKVEAPAAGPCVPSTKIESTGKVSVTHKAKVAQKTVIATIEMESSSTSAPLSLVQSPKLNDGLVPAQTAAQPLGTESSVKADTAPAASVASKVKKAITALPNLNLKDFSFSTHLQVTPPTSTMPPPAGPTTSTSNPLTQQKMFKPVPEVDAVSVASSATLHPREGGQPSPSPSTQDFHTPLQTPVDPDKSREQVEKPKRKKKKNKKKKTPTAAQEGADPVAGASVADAQAGSNGDYDHLADPFEQQISHIDAIRAAVKDPNTYYNQVNREIAERDAKIKADELVKDPQGNTSSLPDPTDFRAIEAFLMENPSMVQKMHDNASK